MIVRLGMMLALLAFGPCQAFADPTPAPPELDCSLGFQGLRNWAEWLPGTQRANDGGREIITLASPETWRVEITVLEQGGPARPVIILRKFLKQVTGVWTAQSKACSFGDKAQFAALLAEIKAEDTRLTNASRDEVARKKKEQSPLGQ